MYLAMRWCYGGVAVPYQDHFELAIHYTLTLRGKCTMLRNTRQATLDRLWNANGRYGYQGKTSYTFSCGRLVDVG